MNTIVFFLAGISIGLATDKLYHALMASRTAVDDASKEQGQVAGTGPLPETTQSPAKEVKVTPLARASSWPEKQPSGPDEGHDDLSRLKGVGPKLEEALHAMGIHRYHQLAGLPADVLHDKLRESGGKFNRTVIVSVVEQARLASEEKKNN